MTAANPDAPREFYGPAPDVDLGDPALDPPCTIRVQGGHDRHTRLFDRDAVRAVKTADPGRAPWVEIAGTEIGWRFTDDDVRDWTVAPVPFATTPWALTATRPTGSAAPELVGDMGVESFRGDRHE